MKRLQLCVFSFLLTFVISGFAQSQSQSQPAAKPKFSMISLCYQLWERTGFGWDEKRTEKGAWVIRDQEGRYQWMEWPDWEERNAIRWKGTIPEGVVAQVHTHPNTSYPEPSKQDADVAKELHIPVYTVSQAGIWRVSVDGKITKEAGEGWHRKFKRSERN
jgi:hypothetical protein